MEIRKKSSVLLNLENKVEFLLIRGGNKERKGVAEQIGGEGTFGNRLKQIEIMRTKRDDWDGYHLVRGSSIFL